MQTQFLGVAHPSAEARCVSSHVFAQLRNLLNLKSAVSCAQLVSQRDTCIYLLNVLMWFTCLAQQTIWHAQFKFLNRGHDAHCLAECSQ